MHREQRLGYSSQDYSDALAARKVGTHVSRGCDVWGRGGGVLARGVGHLSKLSYMHFVKLMSIFSECFPSTNCKIEPKQLYEL